MNVWPDMCLPAPVSGHKAPHRVVSWADWSPARPGQPSSDSLHLTQQLVDRHSVAAWGLSGLSLACYRHQCSCLHNCLRCLHNCLLPSELHSAHAWLRAVSLALSILRQRGFFTALQSSPRTTREPPTVGTVHYIHSFLNRSQSILYISGKLFNVWTPFN